MSIPPAWTTSCYGNTTETTPMELAALGEHVTQCSSSSARLAAAASAVQALKGFVAGRLVTTVAVVALAATACLLFW